MSGVTIDATAITLDVGNPAYSAIYAWIQELLQKSAAQLPNSQLTKWIDSAMARLRSQWPGLPTFDALDAGDLPAMEEALSFLVAAKMRPFVPKTAPTTDLVRLHTQNTHFQYANPKVDDQTVVGGWLTAASEALARVSVIQAAFAPLQSASFFQVAGPRRAQLARGVNTHSIFNPLFTMIADEWDLERQNPIWWPAI